MSEELQKLLALSLSEIEHASSSQALVGELERLAQNAALLAAYFEERRHSGCGEHSHKQAAKAANRVLVRVRRAMGFVVPDAGNKFH